MKTKFLIPLMAGVALLCACSAGNKGETADSTAVVTNRAKNISNIVDTIREHPKQVKTAGIRFQVKDVRQTVQQITALTASYNGTVIHHLMRSVLSDSADIRKSRDSIMRVTVVNATAEMTVKVPPANMETFMNQVALLGIQVNDQKMEVTDKSLDYLSTQLKLKNQRELVDRQKKGTVNQKDPDALLAFKNNIVDQQVSNRRIDDSVKNSIVVLNFYERNVINKKMMANNDLSAYKEPLLARMGMSFENGWNIFTDILAALTSFWVLIPIALGIWVAIKYYRGKSIRAKI